MTQAKKLIEVALPLEAINAASAREKSIRHGHPSTLHLWWARRPLAAARAVIFTSLVDDPDDPNALPAFVEACKALPKGANVAANGDTPRMRLFDFIERLVTWEATTDEDILNTARELIQIATEGNPPPLLDPFAGGGSIPLEAQRLGLEAHASDLNPVAVMINKAQIEIPPRFANMPPVNPRDREKMFAPSPPSPLSHKGRGGAERGAEGEGEQVRWDVSPEMHKGMSEIARRLRREQTPSEDILWRAVRNRKLDGRKFRRQQPVGAFVLDFYCAEERLAVEIDGPIHDTQQEADAERQALLESLGIRFVRVAAAQVETDLPAVLHTIRAAFLVPPPPSQTLPPQGEKGLNDESSPSPRPWERGPGVGENLWRGAAGLAADVRYYGEWMRERAWERIGHLYPPHPPTPSPTGGEGGQKGETVIAWLWARTVKSPNPAVNAHVPLVRSFILSKKKGREKWAKPIVETPSPLNPLSHKGRGDLTDSPSPLNPLSHKGRGDLTDSPSPLNPLSHKGRGDLTDSPSPLNPLSHKGRGDLTDSPSPLNPAPIKGEETPTLNPLSHKGRGDLTDSPSPHEVWERGQGGEGYTIRFEVTDGKPPKGKDGTVNRSGGTCIISGEAIPRDYIKVEAQAGRMGAMLMAIVTEGTSGRSYYSPTTEHFNIAQQAHPEWKPTGELAYDPRNIWVKEYGMTDFGDLFTPRQLVALTTFSDLVHEARDQAHADALAAGLPDDGVPLRDGGRGALAYAEAVSVYLAFAVDKGANLWSSITSWMNDRGAFRETFARQAIPMVWDYAEANPFSNSGGNFDLYLKRIADGIVFLNGDISGIVKQEDAALKDDDKTIVISTDPPYYDNIGYADLSDYFYVWMRKSLRNIYPDVFGTMLVPKEPELIASPYRHGGKEAANEHFEGGMLQTFSNIRRFVSHDYPLTVYYAFKQQDAEPLTPKSPLPQGARGLENAPAPTRGEGLENAPAPREAVGEVRDKDAGRTSTGWETMLTSLIDSGFSIDGTWPVRTESTGRSIAQGTNALASSIVLVCRPRPDDTPSTSRRAFVSDLQRELPAALKEMQSGNIAPVDLAQASIGPGMAIYSRYSAVLEADGTPMSVRAALGLINQVLDETLSEQDGDIDADTRFAVAWFTQFGFDEGEFGQADVLARGKNTSVAGVEAAGVVASGRGKVRLIHWSEYDASALTLNPSPTASRGEGLQNSPSPATGRGGQGGEGWNPATDKRATIWEATHHLIERLNSHGEEGSALLINKMPPDMAAEARQLAYRLYSICERKGWADHARDYNALVVSWAGIGEVAAQKRESAARGDKTEQLGLGGDF